MTALLPNQKIKLDELHEHLVRTGFKNDDHLNTMSQKDKAKYFKDHFKDPEYRQDNWYKVDIPIARLIVAHPEFRSEVPLTKEKTYVSQWPTIRPQLAQHWVLPYDICVKGAYPPIIGREDARKGFYRVWDGQRRTLSCLWHGVDTVSAFAFNNGDVTLNE